MSKKLAKLLAEPETEVAKAIAKLEERCAYPSEDVRILAENKQKVRGKIAQLGLDPDDTTDEELYYALMTRYDKDSQIINKAMGVTAETKLDDRINKAVQLVEHCASIDEAWLIKNSVAKSLLAKNPPKQIIKRLHYRSINSMIKREDVAEVLLMTGLVESNIWQKSLSKLISKLNSSDYELRPLKILKLDQEKWQGVNNDQTNIINDKTFGSIAIWPSSKLNQASILTLTLLLLEGLRDLNPEGYSESLHELSPALRWWADCEYLISDGETPVSLNLKDVALNNLKSHQLDSAAIKHGARALWQELTSRYKAMSAAITDEIPDITYNYDQPNSLPKMPISNELAEEFAMVE